MEGATVVHDVLRRRIQEAILYHIERYPAASDTADGIQRFWLSAQDVGADPAVVEEVLDELALNGVLRKRYLPGGHVTFSLAAPRRT